MILTIKTNGCNETFSNVQVNGIHVGDKETTFFLTERNGTEVNLTYSRKILKDYSYDYDGRDWAAIEKIENPPFDYKAAAREHKILVDNRFTEEEMAQAVKDVVFYLENREARKGVKYLKEALSALEKVEAQTNTEANGILFAVGEVKDLIRGREEKTSGSLS